MWWCLTPATATPSEDDPRGIRGRAMLSVYCETWSRFMSNYLQSPPDLHETSKLSYPVITDHRFLSELHQNTRKVRI